MANTKVKDILKCCQPSNQRKVSHLPELAKQTRISNLASLGGKQLLGPVDWLLYLTPLPEDWIYPNKLWNVIPCCSNPKIQELVSSLGQHCCIASNYYSTKNSRPEIPLSRLHSHPLYISAQIQAWRLTGGEVASKWGKISYLSSCLIHLSRRNEGNISRRISTKSS